MEYGYQGLNPGSKVKYLLNGFRCDKLFTAVAIVRAHPDKYKKDFDAVVAFLGINKIALTPSVKIVSVGQSRPSKQQRTRAICGNVFRHFP